MPGPTLAQGIAAKGPLDAERLTGLAAGLAGALSAIHAAGIVHRDLKPTNVILASNGPKVIDFGIARALEATALTRTSSVIGTPAWMSPEQATGQEVGFSCDVFAWAATITFAATGRPPFGEGPRDAIIYRIVHEQPDLTGVPSELHDIVASALSKTPEDRPTPPDLLATITDQTVAGTAGTSSDDAAATAVDRTWVLPTDQPLADKERWHTKDPTVPYRPPPQPPTSPPKASRRRTTQVIVGAAAIIAMMSVVASSIWPRETGPPTEQIMEVSSGYGHACALLLDEAAGSDTNITCWGPNNPETSPPDEIFSQVSAGTDYSCGVLHSGSASCWGDDAHGKATPPDGDFISVHAGDDHTCGIRDNQTVDCWGSNSVGQSEQPEGQFISVSVGDSHSCGLRIDNTIECWGSDEFSQSTPPSGEFTMVDAGGDHTCAISGRQTATCWGRNSAEASPPANEEFTYISTGQTATSCGIRLDETVACWGYDDLGHTMLPEGNYRGIDTNNFTCGIQLDYSLVCRGSYGYHGASAEVG